MPMRGCASCTGMPCMFERAVHTHLHVEEQRQQDGDEQRVDPDQRRHVLEVRLQEQRAHDAASPREKSQLVDRRRRERLARVLDSSVPRVPVLEDVDEDLDLDGAGKQSRRGHRAFRCACCAVTRVARELLLARTWTRTQMGTPQKSLKVMAPRTR